MKERRITLTVPPELEAELRRIHKGTGISIQILRKATESVIFQDSTIPTKVLEAVLEGFYEHGLEPDEPITQEIISGPQIPPLQADGTYPPRVQYTPRPPTLKLGNLK